MWRRERLSALVAAIINNRRQTISYDFTEAARTHTCTETFRVTVMHTHKHSMTHTHTHTHTHELTHTHTNSHTHIHTPVESVQ